MPLSQNKQVEKFNAILQGHPDPLFTAGITFIIYYFIANVTCFTPKLPGLS